MRASLPCWHRGNWRCWLYTPQRAASQNGTELMIRLKRARGIVITGRMDGATLFGQRCASSAHDGSRRNRRMSQQTIQEIGTQKLTSCGYVLDTSAASLGSLRSSIDLADDAQALRARMREDGY